MSRTYAGYNAHELRLGVLHSARDVPVVLLGPLRTTPGRETTLDLEFPAAYPSDPMIDVRFIEVERISTFIEDSEDGFLPFPPRIDDYPQVSLAVDRAELSASLTGDRPGRMPDPWAHVPGWVPGASEARIGRLSMSFTADPLEGAYLIRVRYEAPGIGEGDFSVLLYGKDQTRFPEDHDNDLSDLLYRWVNLSNKNGQLWFVEPIFVVEQHLGVTLAPEVIEEMVSCEGLPNDLPASDDIVVALQWGRGHHGIRKVRLDVDPLDQPEPCVDHSPLEKRPPTGFGGEFLSEAAP